MFDKTTFSQLKYFLLRFWKELLTACISTLLYIVAFWAVKEPKKLLFWSILITVVGSMATIFLLSRTRDFYYLSLTKHKDADKWFGSGQFKHDRVNCCYLITESQFGFIFAPTLLWDDYTLEFDFKIVRKCLGVIVRAVNLSDYVMLQITEKGIRPHIHINGGWSAFEEEGSGLLFNKRQKLSTDFWYRCWISCDKGTVGLKIMDRQNEVLLNRQWDIPSGLVSVEYINGEEKSKVQLPINLEYGSFGFRNYGNEKALIKNLRVKKI